MAPQAPKDLVLLWCHLVQALEEEEEEDPKGGPNFSKHSQELILQQLHKGKDLLLDGLHAKVQNAASCRRLRLQKGHALDWTYHATWFQKTKKAKAWPVWLTDRGMENLIRSLLAYWEAQQERWQRASGDPRSKPCPPWSMPKGEAARSCLKTGCSGSP